MRALLFLAISIVTGCAATRAPEVAIAPVTTAAVGRLPERCDFTRSRTLSAHARDLSSTSRTVTLLAVADVLAESCSGPLATLASRLHAAPDDDASIDAVLRTTLDPIVPAACLAPNQEECPIPWEVAGLFASEEEWAEDRFFPESQRPHPAALPRGPVLALASAIVARDSSFTARSLAAHALFRRVE